MRLLSHPHCAPVTPMVYFSESHELERKIIRMIRTTCDRQTLLCTIASTLAEYFPIDICVIITGIEAEETHSFGLWAQENVSQVSHETIKQILSHPLVENMISQQTPCSIYNLNMDESVPDGKTLGQLLSIKALLGTITVFQGKPNGIILLGSVKARSWTKQQEQWLYVLAETIALACAILQQKIAHHPKDKELPSNIPLMPLGLSAESHILFRKWYEITRQQLEQQRQLNELKDDIITTISHEAGTPLATMKLAIQMLSESHKRPLSEELQQRYWGILKQELQRLSELISNIKTLQQLESEELSFNPQIVNINFLINDISQSFRQQWQTDKKKRLTLFVDGIDTESESKSTLSIYTDPQHLRSILVELLTNAGKFAPPETNVTLTITQETKNLLIKVTNIGPEISPSEQIHLFEPFHRGEGVTKRAIPGTGLGLALIKGLVELLGGRIEVASVPTDAPEIFATSFTLILPHSTDVI